MPMARVLGVGIGARTINNDRHELEFHLASVQHHLAVAVSQCQRRAHARLAHVDLAVRLGVLVYLDLRQRSRASCTRS